MTTKGAQSERVNAPATYYKCVECGERVFLVILGRYGGIVQIICARANCRETLDLRSGDWA